MIMRTHLFEDFWIEHNGILFWKGFNGDGFDLGQVRLILPQVIRDCRDCYVEGIKREVLVRYNGYPFYVNVNSSAEVRMLPSSYNASD